MFYVNGAARDSAMCGDTIVFDVPGYAEVWLTQYQNNTLQYDNRYTVPSPPYKLSCPQDVGIFVGKAYELVNGQKGPAITSWTFPVAAPASSIVPPSPYGPVTSTGSRGAPLPEPIAVAPGGAPPTVQVTEQPYIPPIDGGAPAPGPANFMTMFQQMDTTTLLIIGVVAYFLFFRKSR